MEGIFGIVEGTQGREREWIGAGAAWSREGIWMILGRASGNEDKMTPHALAKFACFCDKKRSPLKSFTVMASGTDEALQVDAMKKLAYLYEFCRGDGGLATEIGQSDAIHSLLRLWPESDHEFRRVLRPMVIGGLEIVVTMLNLCNDDTSYERKSLSSNRVRRLARCRHVELGVIPVLVDLFCVGDSTTKVVAGNSLGVISVHVDYIRLVAEVGATLLYAELLQGPDFIGKEIAEDVFCILAVAEENAVSIIAEHLVRILREGDDESKTVTADAFFRERVSRVIAKLSYDEADRVALADTGAVPLMIDVFHDESEELRDKSMIRGQPASATYELQRLS
ncbi:hypothetical protein EZV62_008913 [Acer yangbiense]|uniref:Uncharacterized protein n=1 Tax=Acer yangbiense TaxID=1000413 RepID=A0A5C7IF24_9ROSI|nr:hypothetical protein EZV62_008913 [Acer yangbiense]